MARPITFLSDYGVTDEFAGVCRAVIGRIAPEARVIDLGHGLEPGRRLRVTAPRRSDEALYGRTFADVGAGEVLLLVDSSGALALAVNRDDASRKLDLGAGDRVALTRL